jgi:flagellar motility protein MotE (MotC chaperone)
MNSGFPGPAEVKKLKKLIITCEIFILLIFLVKIVMVGGIVKSTDSLSPILSVNQARAESASKSTRTYPVKVTDVSEDPLITEKKLMASLLESQKKIQAREAVLQSREKKLRLLETEILSKIDELRETEKRLTVVVEAIKEVDDKKYQDLARVYESSPPSQASAMLEKMDKKTAAAIIMNMKSKKAGAIWGHISPGKAIEITKEITNLKLSSRESTPR